MAAVTAEVEAKKKPRPASPESRTREEARSGIGNGASAGMPLFLQRSALGTGGNGSAERHSNVAGQLSNNMPGDIFGQRVDRLAGATQMASSSAAAPSRQSRPTGGIGTIPASIGAGNLRERGRSLPAPVRQQVESLLGSDLDGVRVHGAMMTQDEAPQAVRQSGSAVPGDTPDLAAIMQRTSGDSSSPAVPTPASTALPATPSPDGAGSPATSEAMSSQPGGADALSSQADGADAARRGAEESAPGGDQGTRGADSGGEGGGDAGGGAREGGSGSAHKAQARSDGRGGGDHAGAGGEAETVDAVENVVPIIPPTPETHAGDLATGDLVLIDVELAEHQRWAGALGRVGEVASLQRAEFIAEAVGSGFTSGATSGLGMGLAMGVGTRLAEKVVPGIGPVIGGAMALHGLATRDWGETGATIGRFGEGSDTYETLANTIASVAAVIDVVSQILNVINGIVGVVQVAALVIAGGATVAAFFTFGATAGIAIAAGEVAATCTEIAEGITLVTTVLDTVNSAILQPSVTLFRALHAFTTQADPREVEAQGRGISSAAAQSGAALGAWAGGKAAHAGGRPRPTAEEAPPTQRPAHETPPAAPGEGPTIHFQEPVTPAAHAEGAPPPAAHAEPAVTQPTSAGHEPVSTPAAAPLTAPVSAHPLTETAPTSTAATAPQQLSLPGMEAPTPAATPSAPALQAPHPITPDIVIRGDFSDAALRVRGPGDVGPAAAGDIAPHQQQGARGSGLISEHVIPGAQVRDASFDPAHGAPDWQRTTPGGSEGRDYSRATTIVEHAPVSARKTELDNAATRTLQQQGGPRNMREEMVNSLQRHQQAVDDAIAAGEITPQQATDPTHRALAAQAEMWGAGEASGGAKARADAEAAGTSAGLPRRADRLREAEATRLRERLAGEHIEDIDWEATFPNPNRSAPPGTQLALPGMEGMTPRPRAPEQLSLPFPESPNPNQLALPFESGGSVPAPSSGGGGGRSSGAAHRALRHHRRSGSWARAWRCHQNQPGGSAPAGGTNNGCRLESTRQQPRRNHGESGPARSRPDAASVRWHTNTRAFPRRSRDDRHGSAHWSTDIQAGSIFRHYS